MVGWVDDPMPTATLKAGPRGASMAIVPKEAWAVATRATTTAPEPIKTLDAQQLRRKEAHEARVKHFHKQIWTKDPHGGPYKKARPSMPSKDNQRRESEPLSTHITTHLLSTFEVMVSRILGTRAGQLPDWLRPSCRVTRWCADQGSTGIRTQQSCADYEFCGQPHDTGPSLHLRALILKIEDPSTT